MLYIEYERSVIVIIDEYDVPVQIQFKAYKLHNRFLCITEMDCCATSALERDLGFKCYGLGYSLKYCRCHVFGHTRVFDDFFDEA